MELVESDQDADLPGSTPKLEPLLSFRRLSTKND